MDRWISKVAVVTGANSGIGAAVSEKLTKDGLKVIGLDLKVDRIKKLSEKLNESGGELFALECNVTKHEEVDNSFKWIKENIGPVQILVNCAGIFRFGTIIEGNPDDLRNVLETSIMGICNCTREGYKQMKEGDLEGHIIHINSVTGHWHVCGDPPKYNIYSPSKHVVTVMTEVMRREITGAGTRVKVTSISPGAVKTEIWKNAGHDILSHFATRKFPLLNPEDIAESISYVISTPPNVLIQELMIRPMGEDIRG